MVLCITMVSSRSAFVLCGCVYVCASVVCVGVYKMCYVRVCVSHNSVWISGCMCGGVCVCVTVTVSVVFWVCVYIMCGSGRGFCVCV